MIDFYEAFCQKCKKKTRHYALKVSRLRGVKLSCTSCGKQRTRYTKGSELKKWESEQ